ncbi:hypothetical protein QJS66_04560 [Kocuria rhizophila]|nr:hypothetical protein QJS66_04560 [Kocuria rhizophila]
MMVESLVWAVTGCDPGHRGGPAVRTRHRRARGAVGAVDRAVAIPLVLAVILLRGGIIVLGAGRALKQGSSPGVSTPCGPVASPTPALEFAPTTPLSLVDATVHAATTDGYRGWTPGRGGARLRPPGRRPAQPRPFGAVRAPDHRVAVGDVQAGSRRPRAPAPREAGDAGAGHGVPPLPLPVGGAGQARDA